MLSGSGIADASNDQAPADAPWKNGYLVEKDPALPIEVGPREKVGKEDFASKQGKKVVGGILGGLLGGSGKSDRDNGPKTRRDPSRKLDYSQSDPSQSGLECGTRARWTKDGLLVSSYIQESADKGTFQTVFLEDDKGRRLYPAKIEVYKLWTEHSLSVSWSKTSTANGQVVSQESGGWSDTWSETDTWPAESDPGESEPGESEPGETSPEEPPRLPAVWQQVGFNRAQAGVRQLGAYFSLNPEAFKALAGLTFYAHITQPEQDPVVTRPLAWTIEAGKEDKLLTTPAPVLVGGTPEDRQTRSGWGEDSAAKPPCEEAVLRVDEAKGKFQAQLDDPLPLLRSALAAAKRLGQATTRVGQAQASLNAEQTKLDAITQYLGAWDAWSEGKIAKRERSREANYGSRQPAWAKGSSERARKRHQEDSAGLRAEGEQQKQKVEAAKVALANAMGALNSARGDFAQQLAAFANALRKLRGAKDLFTREVTTYYRCSPCQTIAEHFASAARLNDLLDRIRGMLERARAAAAAQLTQAQAAANAAQQAANAARAKFEDMENRRAEIEQEMRDAVKTSDGCLSFQPIEGGSYMDLASMDRVRSTILVQGAAMGWRSKFKGSDVRVYTGRGCLRTAIRNINWTRINKLNAELADLDGALPDAANEATEAQLKADLAQAEVDGLQAEIDAIDELMKALKESGIEQNTEDVLNHLDDLSRECATELKKEIEKIKEARDRKRKANERIAGANGTRDRVRKRAGAAGDAIDGMDGSSGTSEDEDRKNDLKGKADDIEDRAGPGGRPVGTGGGTSPAPDSLEEAERQRKEAEDQADEAEDIADTIEEENTGLEDEVKDLEDELDALDKRLRDWRRYHAAMARYRDCLEEKRKALEELVEINTGAASALRELAKIVQEASDALAGAASDTRGVASLSKKAKAANKKAAGLADALSDISKAMKVLDSVLNNKDIKPSEKLQAMSDAFELVRKFLPELPGVTQMLEFYNETMKAIASKLSEIENALIEYYADAAEADEDYVDMAAPGIREEVKKLVKLRKLMKIISKSCGNSPKPPAAIQ